MSFKFEVIEPKLFAGAAADEVSASVLDILSEKERCSLSLAGGSTPVSVYRALTVSREEAIPWEKLDLFFGDERWVPHSDTQSNMHMVTETLVSKLNSAKPKVFAVNTTLATPQSGAEDYERCISEVVESKAEGCPQLDLVLLGMGDDGHTASVFPGSPLLEPGYNGNRLITVEDWPNQPGSYRITMTPKLLLSAKKIIFLVTGSNKAEMIAKAFDDKAPATLPVHLFRAAKEKVTWLLDSESARLLKS